MSAYDPVTGETLNLVVDDKELRMRLGQQAAHDDCSSSDDPEQQLFVDEDGVLRWGRRSSSTPAAASTAGHIRADEFRAPGSGECGRS